MKCTFFSCILYAFLNATVLAIDPSIVLLDGTRLQCQTLASSDSRAWYLCAQGERKIFVTLSKWGTHEYFAIEFEHSSNQLQTRSFEKSTVTNELHESLPNLERKSLLGDYNALVRLEERMSSSEFKSMHDRADVQEILTRIREDIRTLAQKYTTDYIALEVDLGLKAKYMCTRYGAPPCRLYECREPSAMESKERKILFYDPTMNAQRPFLIRWSTSGKLGPLTLSPRTYAPQDKVPLITPFDESIYPQKETVQLDVPEELSDVATSLPYYLDKNWLRQFKTYTQECTNLKPADGLESFYTGIDKVKDILANTAVRQVLNLTSNGWTSYFSGLADSRERSCQRFRDFGAEVSHLRPTNPDTAHRILSEGEVEDLFRSVSNMNDIAFQCLEDGCYSRAHVVADRIEKRGMYVEKIWLKGDLRPTSSIEWYYHVAPAVLVLNKDGSIERKVIDPSLGTKPLTVDEWVALASGPDAKAKIEKVDFPPPIDTAYYQRRAVAFTNSKVFYIDQSEELTPEVERQNMERALQNIKRENNQKK